MRRESEEKVRSKHLTRAQTQRIEAKPEVDIERDKRCVCLVCALTSECVRSIEDQLSRVKVSADQTVKIVNLMKNLYGKSREK